MNGIVEYLSDKLQALHETVGDKVFGSIISTITSSLAIATITQPARVLKFESFQVPLGQPVKLRDITKEMSFTDFYKGLAQSLLRNAYINVASSIVTLTCLEKLEDWPALLRFAVTTALSSTAEVCASAKREIKEMQRVLEGEAVPLSRFIRGAIPRNAGSGAGISGGLVAVEELEKHIGRSLTLFERTFCDALCAMFGGVLSTPFDRITVQPEITLKNLYDLGIREMYKGGVGRGAQSVTVVCAITAGLRVAKQLIQKPAPELDEWKSCRDDLDPHLKEITSAEPHKSLTPVPESTGCSIEEPMNRLPLAQRMDIAIMPVREVPNMWPACVAGGLGVCSTIAALSELRRRPLSTPQTSKMAGYALRSVATVLTRGRV